MEPISECTRVACWLSTQGGAVSFPLVTISGLVDGINPCAIGMMVLLLGYLLVFQTVEGEDDKEKEKQLTKRMLLHGSVYIITIFLTYLSIGFLLYSVVLNLQQTPLRGLIYDVIGWGLILAGLIQLKDVFKPEWPIHLRIPSASKKWLHPLIERASMPAVIVLGVLVTVLETPCSLPIYVGTATILAQSGLPLAGIVAYFAYYNFLFVLPLIVVLIAAVKMKQIFSLKEWEHKAKSWMHLGLAVVLLLLGFFLVWQ